MRLVQILPKRWRDLAHEFAKFGTIGVINLIVSFAVFNLMVLTLFRNGELKANVVATVVATTGAYVMNRHWTYRHRPKSTLHREYTLFFFFNLVGLVIELSVLGIAKYGLGIRDLIALNVLKAAGLGLGTIFRFWSYRTHVFRPGPSAAADKAPSLDASTVATSAAAAAAEPSAAQDVSADLAEEIELDGIILSGEQYSSRP